MKESQVTREQVNVKLNISNYRKISADESEEQKVFFLKSSNIGNWKWYWFHISQALTWINIIFSEIFFLVLFLFVFCSYSNSIDNFPVSSRCILSFMFSLFLLLCVSFSHFLSCFRTLCWDTKCIFFLSRATLILNFSLTELTDREEANWPLCQKSLCML